MTIRYAVPAAIVAAMIMVTGPVQAQTPTPSTTDQVKTWTLKKWNEARAEFVKDKAKWADCRKQGTAKKLKGKASWEFLYDCMKA
jgi:hypothetical protein